MSQLALQGDNGSPANQLLFGHQPQHPLASSSDSSLQSMDSAFQDSPTIGRTQILGYPSSSSLPTPSPSSASSRYGHGLSWSFLLCLFVSPHGGDRCVLGSGCVGSFPFSLLQFSPSKNRSWFLGPSARCVSSTQMLLERLGLKDWESKTVQSARALVTTNTST